MADTKISAEPNASALGGTEQLIGVQSAANVNITPAQLATFAWATPTLVAPVYFGGVTAAFPALTNTTLSNGWALDLKSGANTNGQLFGIYTLTELLTIAAAATSTTTIQKPANSIVLAVSVRVTVAVTCTSTFTVGDAGSAARFSTAAVSKALNSTDPGTKAGAFYNSTAQGIVITPDSQPSDATGRVRVTIHYINITPPTS